MSGLETFTLAEIAAIIEDRSGCGATANDDTTGWIDVDGKVGKEVFGPLADEGIHVVAILPRETGVRVWFEERGVQTDE